MSQRLLPSNATPWEMAAADALAPISLVSGSIAAMHGAKLVAPPPSFLPFLIWEYGLGELSPYVPNLYELVDEGIDWQRVRGTPLAIAKGLEWIGYSAALEEALPIRKFWNSFQLRLDSLPANDNPDLRRIEGIAGLSVPLRSKLRRGVYEYDVPAVEADHSYLDHVHLDRESGVVFTAASTVWSFGRTHEFAHTLTETEGTALDMWVPSTGEPLTWNDLNFSWEAADFAWNADPATQRAIGMAGWFDGRLIYCCLRNAAAEIIGYRRARCCHRVAAQPSGPYKFDGLNYAASEGGSSVYIEILTGFGDGQAEEADTATLVYGLELADGVKPGTLWLLPDDATGGTEFAEAEATFLLRPTVRDNLKFMVQF